MARLVHVYSQTTRVSGVFCERKERFVISDDWATIKPASTSTVLSLLHRALGGTTVKDGGYEELDVDVGWAEVVSLLKTCNSSTTIFTDALLLAKDRGAVRRPPALTKRSTLPLRTTHKRRRDDDGHPGSDSMAAQIGLKLFFDRQEKKVLYAECSHQFVDLLLSFLTYPLGCVLKNLAGTSHLYGSFNNLYSNAAGLLSSSSLSSSMLLDPSIAPFKNPGDGGSEKAVAAWHHLCRTPAGSCSCPLGERSCRWCDRGFVDDYTYVVDDDLSIHQASAASVLRHWCNRDAGQVAEVDIIAISKQEAVALLLAAVNSKTALTDVFKGRLLDQLQRRRMQIFVKILTGETITLDVESSDTIAAVRRKIQAKGKFIESRGLVYCGKLLQDPWTLADCGIHREATIHAEF
ncbi:uncharacterized protein LOC104582440 [Brachypodium distachyon]|uniref:uncharacterized protein LOC104582440 n=1 Tax=Brachypodium distachyon TaxID=15368 RepID=UPI00052FF802|nr:uncharacterized protein LOC104582440 [Brachypodium distachyon]|eukprot:XP_010230294.1 uncharacterized protein LOC104582440 [Brachypodium distachyon]